MRPGSVRWGIVGPGRIAENVIADFVHVPGADVVAVASRSSDRAQAFADRHAILRAYGSYRELLADSDVDVVYLATPHPQHLAVGVAAANAGKSLLVEKAFAATLAGAQTLVEAARANRVFAMEAMWTRFQPAVVKARELLADAAIGDVRSVQVDLGVVRAFDPSDRQFAYELGGGTMLDLGVYLISFAQMVLGTATSVSVHGALEPSGVDAEASLLLGYPEGRTATLMCSFHSPMPGHARIFGSTGWIDVTPRFHHPRSIVLHRHGAEPERFDRPATGAGYAHELIEVTEALAAGRTESTIMPLDDTLEVQRVMEMALGDLGIQFTDDDAL